MSGPHPSPAAPDMARWLGLAASPTFAAMALLTGLSGGGAMDAMCSMGHGPLLGGMVPMYLLMSAFHSPPWLRLVSGRRRGPARGAEMAMGERVAGSSV